MIYTHENSVIQVHGIPFFKQHGKYVRISDELFEKMPNLSFLGKLVTGARLRFRTNSQTIKVSFSIAKPHCPSYLADFSAVVFYGKGTDSEYAGHTQVEITDEGSITVGEFKKNADMQDVTIFFPKYAMVSGYGVEIEEGAVIEAPTPYKYNKPILFYGSSITQGGTASICSNAYTAMLSRWLDFDYYNMGFAGNAKGEIIMADYLNTIDFAAFVLDYDHNAGYSELRETHEPFFKRIREAHPDVPILMMSRPNTDEAPEGAADRRDIILNTLNNAKAAGDDKVYFINGETFFGKEHRMECTVDKVHPNDLGHYRMATTIEPVLKEILEKYC